MTMARRRRALCLLLALTTGCAGFNEGVADSFEQDVDPEGSWAAEFYEMPLGLIGLPLLIALSPIIYFIPAGDEGVGYRLGRGFGADFIFLDPTSTLATDEPRSDPVRTTPQPGDPYPTRTGRTP